ncbi:hypothetical protein SDC9_196415 [bioreactor metagenome]|uniref:Uncharacterized protein n=1 Tax=bioreactor metagenome TaxID=1076179 RepID=A0A645INJ0_9ZZZZ
MNLKTSVLELPLCIVFVSKNFFFCLYKSFFFLLLAGFCRLFNDAVCVLLGGTDLRLRYALSVGHSDKKSDSHRCDGNGNTYQYFI